MSLPRLNGKVNLNLLLLTMDVPITPREPGSTRFYDLMRGLAERGHQLTLVCPVSSMERWQHFYEIEGGRDLLRSAYPLPYHQPTSWLGRWRTLLSHHPWFDNTYRHPAEHRFVSEAVTQLLRSHDFDILHVDYLPMAQYAPIWHHSPIVVDARDAISLTMYRQLMLKPLWCARGLELFQALKVRHFERAASQRADAYVVNTSPDLDYLSRYIAPAKLRCIPDVVDCDFFHPSPTTVLYWQFIFTGKMDYPFNIDAVLHFHRHILPIIRRTHPSARFAIVGANPPAEVLGLAKSDPLTHVSGYVQDVRPYIWQSSVYVSPLRSGTGMKNKVLNAMAMGKPVVATPTSCSGIDVTNHEHLIVAESDEDFAAAACCLLRNSRFAAALGAAARKHIEAHYGRASLAMAFEDLYSTAMRNAELVSER